jgi:hypothetical protein
MEAYGAEEWAACWVGASTARRARSGDLREPGAGSRGRRELRAGIGESLAGGGWQVAWARIGLDG